MKTLFLECSMGAAGDMLTAALLDLLEEKDQLEIIGKLNSLGLDDVSVSVSTTAKCGINGKHVSVKIAGEEEHSHDVHHHDHDHHDHDHHDHDHHDHDHHDHDHHHEHTHHHSSLHDIKHIIDAMPVSDKVKSDALNVYTLIAKAEGYVHGKDMTEIHFHEVGTKDAIVDVVAVCMLMEKLAPEKVIVSPIHVGSGFVKCAHGILPVPAPATAHILTGIPTYGGGIKGELCTPTGAALIKYFAENYGDMPLMTVSKTGYGMGTKDFEIANCVRAMIGDIAVSSSSDSAIREELVSELVCNVDDMTAEAIGYAIEVFMSNGALDAYAVATTTKKSRPGRLLTVLCGNDRIEDMVALIMKHTSTIGIRRRDCERYTLKRREEVVESSYGPIRKKVSTGYGVVKEKYEYDDVTKIARENGLSIAEVITEISK